MATKPSLALIPSAYNTSEVYSVLPTNGDGDFDFSRIGTATRINKDGLIETVGANIPRLDYSDGGCPSLLLEPQRTNLLTYSEDFSQSVWSKQNGSTIENSDEPSPKGDLSAKKIIRGTNDLGLRYTGATTLGTEYTFSLYAKKGNHNILGLDIGDVITNFDLTDEWQRFSVTVTPAAYTHIDIELSGSLQGDFIHIFGAQLEQASYESSYIPTLTGGISTIYADECNKTNIQEYIGQTEGTLFLDFEYLMDVGTDPANDNLRDIIYFGSNTDTSEYITVDNYRSQFRVYVIGSGMTTVALGLSASGSALANTRYKLAIKYKSGDFKCYRNGVLIGSNSGILNFASPLNSFYFSLYNGTFNNQKRVNDLRIYKTALTDQELIELTTI